MNKNDARQRTNDRLTEDIKMQELGMNALRALCKRSGLTQED